MKKRWQLWVGLVISAVALAWVIYKIDLGEVARTLAQANYVYLVPAAVGILIYLLARSVRWWLLLRPQVSFLSCFWVTNIGYLVSDVLPFRLGDPARAVIVGRSQEVSTTAALSTVVVERVLDLLMVVILLAVVVPFVSETGSIAGRGLIAGGAVVVALAGLLMLAFRPDWGRWIGRLVLGWVPRLDEDRWLGMLDGLLEGLAPLRSARRGLALLAWSVITWACVVVYYWTLMWAFVPRPSFLAAAFVVCGVGLGMSIPSSPGAMGVYHAVVFYILTDSFGMPEGQAGTIAFALHTFQYVVGCLMGLIGLVREGLSLGWVRAHAVTMEEAA